ncbi:hypothetical protein IE81DRAFT_232329 [Ceraceosorus guamensis]|uniref:Uncharacterized protein n=1 Tax=Ceraceosorus guamensis TaxID=1522189 RepID=A0A316VRU4_9BASI|nr:hypothetical protein IE81DRAFT_232329 [Ceraceosorus guamensis]PWN40317.1 hypothetical protein IE81DRAFT_232329 [Ceraceosorus guamensis]
MWDSSAEPGPMTWEQVRIRCGMTTKRAMRMTMRKMKRPKRLRTSIAGKPWSKGEQQRKRKKRVGRSALVRDSERSDRSTLPPRTLSRKAARSRAAKARQTAALASKSILKAKATRGDAALSGLSGEEEEDKVVSSLTATSQSTRLDPKIFESVFGSAASLQGNGSEISNRPTTAGELAEALKERRQVHRAEKERKNREGGVVRGRDGESMKRLRDGRTVVRSAAAPRIDLPGSHEDANPDRMTRHHEEREDILLPQPVSFRAGETRPAARSRAFLKRSLKLYSAEQAARKAVKERARKTNVKGTATPKKTTDDPLGMEDPAFLPGGEFYKGDKKLTGKRGKRGRAPVPKKDSAFGRSASSHAAFGRTANQGPALLFSASAF